MKRGERVKCPECGFHVRGPLADALSQRPDAAEAKPAPKSPIPVFERIRMLRHAIRQHL